MILSVLALAAALTANSAPKAEIGRTRLVQPKVVLSRLPSNGPSAFIAGGVVVSYSGFKAPSVHRPVLHMTCLCEVNGALECYHGFWDEPETYKRLSTSVLNEAFKSAGIVLKGEEKKRALSDPAVFTPLLPAVTKDRYAKPCTYGDSTDSRNGFFRLRKLSGPARLLLVRHEIWQNGVKVCEHESSRTGLGGLGIPEDWHVWRKHPEKFRYVETR